MRKTLTLSTLLLLLLPTTCLLAQPCATPSNVTATPSVICSGGSSNLNATSTGNNIDWYTVPTGGTSIGTSASGANFSVSPVTTTTYYAEAVTANTGSQTFSFTGTIQNFTVPPGVTSITMDVRGAQGGNTNGGKGAQMVGTFAVTPGEGLAIVVGKQGVVNNCGGAGASGGGGGGSFVWRLSSTALPMIAAGGGGGGNTNWTGICVNGIDAVTTQNGTQGNGPTSALGGTGGNGGAGNAPSGTGSGGGGWLTAGQNSTYGSGCTGGMPAFTFTGGNGSTTFGPGGEGGFGGGGGAVCGCGGGGGYSGGGGGEGSSCRAGGGGGSYNVGTNQSNTAGVQLGNGQVVFTWTGNGCTSSTRVPVTVSLDNVPPTAICQPVTVQLDANGNGSTTAAAVNNGSTDNCSVSSLSLSQTAFTCVDAGVHGVTLTVTDGNGNTATCAVNLMVIGPPIQVTMMADTNSCGYNVSCNNGNDGIAHALVLGGCSGFTFLWSSGQTTSPAIGLGAGMHYVTITDAGGQSVVDSIMLTTTAPLQAQTSTTPSCANVGTGTATVTPSGGNDCQSYSVMWSSGGSTNTVTGLTAGTYTVTVTDIAGCTTTQTVTVAALPAPAPTVSQSGNTLTSVQTWSSYQWLLNGNNIPGATADSYTATQSGSYALSVTDSNGCTGVSDTIQITIVGIVNPSGNWGDLSIHPNPLTTGAGQNVVWLRTATPIASSVRIQIQDMFGRLVLQRNLVELLDEVALDVHDLAAGTYLLHVTSDAGQEKQFKLILR